MTFLVNIQVTVLSTGPPLVLQKSLTANDNAEAQNDEISLYFCFIHVQCVFTQTNFICNPQ